MYRGCGRGRGRGRGSRRPAGRTGGRGREMGRFGGMRPVGRSPRGLFSGLRDWFDRIFPAHEPWTDASFRDIGPPERVGPVRRDPSSLRALPVDEAGSRRKTALIAAVDAGLCQGCGACTEVCPREAVSLWNGSVRIDEDRCVGCGACLSVCRPGAITLREI